LGYARWLLIGSLWFLGCSPLLGNHPFSPMPGSSGKLDKTPNVLIVSGQDLVHCVAEGPARLYFFIHLRWMPAQEVLAWSGDVKPETPAQLFGTQLTVRMLVTGPPPGVWATHVLTIQVGKQLYRRSTILANCPDVSAEPGWTSSDTANGSVELVGG
jgi:hypothetical protein